MCGKGPVSLRTVPTEWPVIMIGVFFAMMSYLSIEPGEVPQQSSHFFALLRPEK